jgi:hypothetical protein
VIWNRKRRVIAVPVILLLASFGSMTHSLCWSCTLLLLTGLINIAQLPQFTQQGFLVLRVLAGIAPTALPLLTTLLVTCLSGG